jgi:hypothetical protein
MPASWDFILTDLVGTQIGQITNAADRTIALPLGRTPTCSFKVPLFHSYAPAILDGDTLLQAWRNDGLGGRALRFNGPIISAEEVGDNLTQSIAVTATGPFWRLTKRIIPGTDAITGFRLPAAGEDDLGHLALQLLTTVNGAHAYGYTGITPGTDTKLTSPVATGIVNYEPGSVKVLAEAITELSTPINSFEFEIAPTVPTSVGAPWPQIGVMNTAPLIGGVNRENAIFEYGTTRANVTKYSRVVDRSGIDNSTIILPPSWPNTTEAKYTAQDSASISSRGLFEDHIDSAGIESADLRQKLATEHTAIRKDPRQIITFTPALNARPAPFTDYSVGDYVRARAVVRGIVRFDGVFRIWGVTITLDQNGNESVELELQTP